MDKDKEIAIKFAKGNGYDTAVLSKEEKWIGNPLYVARYKDHDTMCLGPPKFIIIENQNPRFANGFLEKKS